MIDDDILDALADLHKQATTERSHYYTASVVRRAMQEITDLRRILAAGRFPTFRRCRVESRRPPNP